MTNTVKIVEVPSCNNMYMYKVDGGPHGINWLNAGNIKGTDVRVGDCGTLTYKTTASRGWHVFTKTETEKS